MLPNDTIKTIQETAVRAADAKILGIPGDERNSYLIHNGTAEKIVIPSPVRKHSICDLGELCRYVKPRSGVESSAVVWHSAREIVAILDDSDRRDRVSLKLEYTAAWAWIERAAKTPERLAPKAFASLLRTTLADVVESGKLLEFQTALRNVRLTSKQSVNMETDRGRDALGKSIEQECANVDAIPETLDIHTTIYRNAGDADTIADVSFDVSIDFDAGLFVLTAIGDRVAEAVDGAQVRIGDYIRVESKLENVFNGTP